MNRERKIAVLRGINVGGRRKILMADLKQLFLKLGCRDVESYIQSGNVIFTSEKGNAELEKELEAAILKQMKLDVPVILRSLEEWVQMIKANPFYSKDSEINSLYVTLLKEEPEKKHAQQLQNVHDGPDRFEIEGKNIFLECAGKYYATKWSNHFFEKKLQVQASSRNWKTVLKLAELADKGR